MAKQRESEYDVTVKTYTYNGKDKTNIVFHNGMDELIDFIFVNLVISKGCLFFMQGNIDAGAVKLDKNKHMIQSSNQKIQKVLRSFNGHYQLKNGPDEETKDYCCIYLGDRIELEEDAEEKQAAEVRKKQQKTENKPVKASVTKSDKPIEQKTETKPVTAVTVEQKPAVENKTETKHKEEKPKVADESMITITTLLSTLEANIDKTEVSSAILIVMKALLSKITENSDIVLTIKTLLKELETETCNANAVTKSTCIVIENLLENMQETKKKGR